MRHIMRELRPFTAAIVLLSVAVFGSVVCSLGLPSYLAGIINVGIPLRDMPYIVHAGGSMLVLTAIGGLAGCGTGFFSARISMGVGRKLREQVFRRVQHFSQAEFDHFQTASLITRTGNDITQVQNFINMFLRIVLMAPIMCIGGVVLAYQKSPSMSVALLVSIPVMMVAVLVIARRALPLSTAMQKKLDRLNLVLREKLTGVRVIRAFGAEAHEAERFADASGECTHNAIRMQRTVGLLTPVLSFVLYGTTVALLLLGKQQLLAVGGLPVGDIIAVIQYVMQIMMSVMMLAMVFVMYPRASVSAGRIGEVLDATPSVCDAAAPVTPEPGKHGYLTFEDVSFTYPGASAPALSHISFTAKPGEITAIIGSTGSGKSTLLNLIPRFFDVTDGRVLVDGVDVRDYSLHDLRARLGYIPQKAFLFRGTIDENLRFGAPDADDDRIEAAAHVAQAYEFITEKKEGFRSAITQGGTNVSGGQRQRLSIARAAARQPEVYLFDDSFSALDFKTDAAVRRALAAETEQSTVVIVAQRVSTIESADRILVLEDGALVGLGTHKELLNSCAVYREIVASQRREGEGA